MKVPYWLQGTLFAPALIGLVFLLKFTCPHNVGLECFSDHFAKPIFMPIGFVYRTFGELPLVTNYEPIIILLYWAIVGLLVGLCFDLLRNRV